VASDELALLKTIDIFQELADKDLDSITKLCELVTISSKDGW